MRKLSFALLVSVLGLVSAIAQPRLQITYGLAGSGLQGNVALFNTTSPYIGINLGYDWKKKFVETGVEFYSQLADTLSANTFVFPFNVGAVIRTEPAMIYLGLGYGFGLSEVFDPSDRISFYNTHSLGVIFGANISLGDNGFLTLRYRALTNLLTNYPVPERFLNDMSSLSIGLSAYLFRKKQ